MAPSFFLPLTSPAPFPFSPFFSASFSHPPAEHLDGIQSTFGRTPRPFSFSHFHRDSGCRLFFFFSIFQSEFVEGWQQREIKGVAASLSPLFFFVCRIANSSFSSSSFSSGSVRRPQPRTVLKGGTGISSSRRPSFFFFPFLEICRRHFRPSLRRGDDEKGKPGGVFSFFFFSPFNMPDLRVPFFLFFLPFIPTLVGKG